jgi:hypothetical protein
MMSAPFAEWPKNTVGSPTVSKSSGGPSHGVLPKCAAIFNTPSCNIQGASGAWDVFAGCEAVCGVVLQILSIRLRERAFAFSLRKSAPDPGGAR